MKERQPRPWLPDEIESLRQWYATKRTAWIAKALNRSAYSIYAKADELHLKKSAQQRREISRLGAMALHAMGLAFKGKSRPVEKPPQGVRIIRHRCV